MAQNSKESALDEKVYVGGLAYSVTDPQLQQLFASHGNVESAKVMRQRETNRSRGVRICRDGVQEEAEKAIAALNGTLLNGEKPYLMS